ncbi:MAG: LAGLIDADG family homing endonuclease, partial [Candidatus Micrarchaeota archaeon]
LFEADGCVFSKGRGKRAVQFKSSEVELLRDVQVLLLRFGIHSRIIGSNLAIRRAKSIRAFAENIGFKSVKKSGRLKKLVKDCKDLQHELGQQRSERIISVRPCGVENVFDIEVPQGNRFIANGIISHNTAKSRILQYISLVAPKCIYVAGRGASGVGLCVAPDSLVLQNDSGLDEISRVVESNLGNVREDEKISGAFYSECSGNKVRIAALDDAFKIGFQDAEKVWRIKAPSKLSKICTRRGKSLTTTPNTPVLRLKNSVAEWVEASKVTSGDFIATSRRLPALRGKPIKLLDLIENPRVTANDCTGVFRKISDLLAGKHGSLEAAAEAFGVSRDRFYLWRMNARNVGIPLQLLKKMANEAGVDLEVENLSVRDGKRMRLPKYADSEFFYLLGLIAADGDIYQKKKSNSVGIRLHNNNEFVVAKAKKTLEKLGVSYSFLPANEKRAAQLRFGSVILAELFKKLGVPSGKKSGRIDLPAVLNNSTDEMRWFIRAVFDCDGFVSLNKGRGSNCVGFSTCSENFAKKLQLLLEQQGIASKLRLRKRVGKTSITKYGSKITSRLDQYYVEIRGLKNFLEFKRKIGFSNSQKAEKLDLVLAKISKPHENLDLMPNLGAFLTKLKKKYALSKRLVTSEHRKESRKASRKTIEKISSLLPPEAPERDFLLAVSSPDVFWDEVVESKTFENTGTPWVYDFTLPSHAFVANGIIVHNTAAAEKDKFGEGWVLKAGAMVLASGGVVAIDEFDKMNVDDRAAIHEALEQQTISIAKAGMVTQFKAKTSVLAAANPKMGRFDPTIPPALQFDIPPTLLSRFDLIFTIKDVLDESRDKKMADHILLGHKVALQKQVIDEGDSAIMPPVDTQLLRKYIAFARRNVFPVLTDEAGGKIKDYYVELRRMGEKDKTFPVTARQIEGLVRLAEANAKMRLSSRVEVSDAEAAIQLVTFVLNDVFVDRETGKIDSDLISIGVPKSKTDKVRSLMGLISKLEEEFELVPVDELMRQASAFGIDQDYAARLLEDLIRQGDLYKPKPGHVKTARPRDW